MENNPYDPANSTLSDSQPPKSSLGKFFRIVLMGFGVLFVFLIGIFIFVGVYTAKMASDFSEVGEPFLEKFVSDQSPWNYETAKTHISKLWLEQSSDADNQKVFLAFKSLGKLITINEIQWLGCSTFNGLDRCNYAVNATYEKGDARILAGLIIEQQVPKFVQLNINSDAFLNENVID